MADSLANRRQGRRSPIADDEFVPQAHVDQGSC
jgi:hypothetical protein